MENDIVLTSGYAEDLENVRLGVWGQRRRRRGGSGRPRSCEADSWCAWGLGGVTSTGELDAISMHCMYMDESLPGSLCGLAEPGQDN